MRALLSKEVGGPDTLHLETIADPQPGPGDVLLRVKACGVNFPDFLIIQDLYQFKPTRPFSPGGEVAGIVEAVGAGVSNVAVGDRVFGSTSSVGLGGMAELVVIGASRCLPMPASMPFADAAAFIVTYGTAMHALKQRGMLSSGETMLVLGASGGVGLAAVDLGKAMGARVVAAASSQDRADFAIERGADRGMVYSRDLANLDPRALAGEFKEACGPNGADVIVDPVGGPYAEQALRACAWGGRYLVVGFPAGIPSIPLNLPLLKGCAVVGVFWGEFTARQSALNDANLQELLALYVAGSIKPYISQTFDLERAGEAIAQLASRKAVGKIVVTMD